ncbi:glycosyltransferase family 2 protein [Cohnella algarum]|nr:glycosyltransferase family 2 protein [Cohnella algarum]
MLVFILDAADGKLAQRTEDGIAAACAGCRFVRVAAGAAATMNRVLTDYAEPFFATFTAGDAVQPEFFELVARSLPSLGPKDAGIVALLAARKPNPAEEPSAPIVWRTEAVRSSGGFAEPDLLPFERYVLLEKKLRLDPFHTWKTVPADGFLPKPRRNLGWHKTAREWRELKPLLSGTNTSPLENERPLLSIVLCTYNNADVLLWAVRSVRVQTFRDWELIVADDGSTDRTRRILDEHPLLMDSRVRVLRIERNRGKARRLEFGFIGRQRPMADGTRRGRLAGAGLRLRHCGSRPGRRPGGRHLRRLRRMAGTVRQTTGLRRNPKHCGASRRLAAAGTALSARAESFSHRIAETAGRMAGDGSVRRPIVRRFADACPRHAGATFAPDSPGPV